MRSLIMSLGICFLILNAGLARGETETLASDAPQPNEWPMVIDVTNAVITVFQPQLESFADNKLTCRAAVSVKRNDHDKTDYCAIFINAAVDTDKETRIVKLRDLQITNIAYPDASEKVKESLGDIIRKNILKADMSISLDRLLAMLDTVEKQQRTDHNLENNVPEFFFSNEAAALVSIDGDPVFKDIGDGMSQVVNSNFLIIQDTADKKCYLECSGNWFSSEEIMGPWAPAAQVPAKISNLQDNKDADEPSGEDTVIPKIFVSTKPAELIQSYGEPELQQIPGTKLSYLKNSDNDIFRDTADNKLYILASGRWFSADTKEGPWSYVAPDKLPVDFKEIPPDSPKSNVLASVSGTNEANDAVMESYIPQTAKIKRGSVSLDIAYDGDPEFQQIEGTAMSFAVNTQTPVVKLNNKYYACDNGAWYESSSPQGNWEVCAKVPDDIYTIPPSCPIYNSTYVKVYDSTDDSVDVGYTSGYNDSYNYGGVIVYGTGYRYPYWYRHHWWPRPLTYGYRYRYDRHDGYWRRYDRYLDRHGKYVPWNNRPFPHVRPLPEPGHGPYRGLHQPVAGNYNAYRNNKGVMHTPPVTRQNIKNVTRDSPAHRTPANNVYAGKDGTIYRHGLDGWEKNANGNWNHEKPAPRIPQQPSGKLVRPAIPVRPVAPSLDKTHERPHSDLNSHYNARERGDHRIQTRNSYHPSSHGISRSGGRTGGGGGRR